MCFIHPIHLTAHTSKGCGGGAGADITQIKDKQPFMLTPEIKSLQWTSHESCRQMENMQTLTEKSRSNPEPSCHHAAVVVLNNVPKQNHENVSQGSGHFTSSHLMNQICKFKFRGVLSYMCGRMLDFALCLCRVDNMLVVAGDYSLSIYEGTEQEFLPQLVVPHPGYNTLNNDNDIMLVKAKYPNYFLYF